MATKTQKKKAAPVTAVVTLADFDSVESFRVIRDGIEIDAFTPLTLADFQPRGGTPLLDASATFIAHLGTQAKAGQVTIGLLLDRSGSMGGNEAAVVSGVNEFVGSLAAVEEVDPETSGKVLAVIFTDGMENMSKEVDNETLAGIITAREAAGWTFIFLGANIDAWATGRGFGLSGRSSGQTVNYASTPKGTRSAWASVGQTSSSYLAASGQTLASLDSSGLSSRTITEDGTEIGANVDPNAYRGSAYDIANAIKTAKKATKK
jgi:hypothetical protein